MKKIVIFFLGLIHIGLSAQTTSKNYVKTVTPIVPVQNQSALNGLADNQKRSNVSYYDGLGRLSQNIKHRYSPTYKDQVEFNIYDNTGRITTKYLPYIDSQGNLSYKENPILDQGNFYNNTARVAKSSFPFSEIVYENSPLNRILEQSSVGQEWQIGEGHTARTQNEGNTANEVRLWKESQGNIISVGFYPANELFKVITTDRDGYQSVVYTNKQGKVVMKKSQISKTPTSFAETHYVYNDFYKPVAVIPPQAFSEMTNYDVNAEVIDRVYRFKYDSKQRLIEKKVPHKGTEYIVYDKLDRPILRQDSKQLANGQWSFIKYDELGREIMTGLVNDVSNRSNLQLAADLSSFVFEQRTSNNFSTQHGYTNQSFPNSSALDIHIVKYYDDYDFNNDGSDDVSFSNPPSSFTLTSGTQRNAGLLTGGKVKILNNSNTYLLSSSWYDDKGRIIQVQEANHLGGSDITHFEYNFAGEMTRQVLLHDDGTNPVKTLSQRFVYDHTGRLRQTYHKVNNQAEILLSEYIYNHLGQLIDKKLHARNAGAPKFLQSIDYAYNIKGWLTHINNANLNDDQYVSNQANPGAILSFDISKLDFRINEVNDEKLGGHFLELWVEDESDMTVEGEVNTEQYKNDGAAVLRIMNYPEEGDNENLTIYNNLLNINKLSFEILYEEEPLTINNETRIETLQDGIYADVFKSLEGSELNDESAIKRIQEEVFNYITGKAGHVLEVDIAPFSSKYLQYYFSEKNNHQLFMTVWDATQSQSHEVFIMTRTTENSTECDYLLGLTNLPDKTITLIVDFELANLYEGMSTVEAINECKNFQSNIMDAYNITNSTVLGKMEDFAINFAFNEYGNTYFNNDANDVWGMEIRYNSNSNDQSGYPFGINKNYSGNINEINWQSVTDKRKRAYGYSYDGLSRLTSATYKAFDKTSNNWNLEIGRYSLPQITYDLNGNIQSLQRNGFINGVINQNASFGLMDNLQYNYTGDQLNSVDDLSGVHYQNDFDDGNTNGNDYSYDVNGNLISDLNKGLSSIDYNHLNLPITIDNGNGEVINYVYDATGKRLQKLFNNYGSIVTTDYSVIGNYVTIGSGARNLSFINTPEGRLIEDNGQFRYEYYINDHLGNVRIGFSDYNGDDVISSTEVTQQHNYYPFGLEHMGTFYGLATQTNHKYLFNGKEFQNELNLNWTAMDFRGLDHQLGRFFSIDPLADEAFSWTPYRFGFNNPISLSDPTGLLEGGPGDPNNEFGDNVYVGPEVVITATRLPGPWLANQPVDNTSNPFMNPAYQSIPSVEGRIMAMAESAEGVAAIMNSGLSNEYKQLALNHYMHNGPAAEFYKFFAEQVLMAATFMSLESVLLTYSNTLTSIAYRAEQAAVALEAERAISIALEAERVISSSLKAEEVVSEVITTWNQFQRATAGQFASRAEAAEAWEIYKEVSNIITNTTSRSQSQKVLFLKNAAESGKYPKWMNQFLKEGKVPPGYHVDHIKPISIGGEDIPANMRLLDIDFHINIHHKLYRPWQQ